MQKCHCGQVIFDPFKTKPQGGNTFLKIRPFLTQGSTLEAGLSATPAQKLLLRGCTSPENFKHLFIPSKVIHIFTKDRRTDRQTNPPHPYTGGRNFFMPVFDTFSLHYVRFAHSVREG